MNVPVVWHLQYWKASTRPCVPVKKTMLEDGEQAGKRENQGRKRDSLGLPIFLYSFLIDLSL